MVFMSATSYSQDTLGYPICEVKLGIKGKDGRFYDYFLFTGKGTDTFQVIHITNKKKSKTLPGEPPMLGTLIYEKGIPIKEEDYKNYAPYIKPRFRAYYNEVGLIFI